MKYLISLLLSAFFALSVGFAGASSPRISQHQVHPHQSTIKQKWKKRMNQKIQRKLKKIKEKTKGEILLNISVGFSLLTLLASLVIPTSAGWGLIILLSGLLFFAILFLVVGGIVYLRERRQGLHG